MEIFKGKEPIWMTPVSMDTGIKLLGYPKGTQL